MSSPVPEVPVPVPQVMRPVINSTVPAVEVPRPISRSNAFSNNLDAFDIITPTLPVDNLSTPLPEENSSSKNIIIYSNISQGRDYYRSPLKTITLPVGVIPSSILALNESEVVRFTYSAAADLLTSVRQSDVSVYRGPVAYQGKLVSMDDDTVTLLSSGQLLRIREYDRLVVPTDIDYTQPRLTLSDTSSPTTVNYLFAGLSWKCTGAGILNGKQLQLRLAANIKNKTGQALAGKVSLASGDIALTDSKPQPYYAQARSASPIPGEKAATQSLMEDYVSYDIGYQVLDTESIVELGLTTLDVTKAYQHTLHDGEGVSLTYRFTAPQYLPACKVNIYDNGESGIGNLLGQTEMEELRSGDEGILTLGTSTLVQCQTELVRTDASPRSEEKDYRDRRVEITTRVTNHNLTEVLLVLQYYIGTDEVLETTCPNYTRKNNRLEWYFKLSPGQEDQPYKTTFQCNLVVRSRF